MRLLLWTMLMISAHLIACQSGSPKPEILFETLDTDFSKGRLTHKQTVTLKDLEKFHGHACDGLVLGALAMQEAMKVLYPDQAIDRTNLRIISKPSPCLTDVAIYLTGGRYQFNTFYVDTAMEELFTIQRIDNFKTVRVALKAGIKPAGIDSLGNLAIQQNLSPCELDNLKSLEDQFSRQLLKSDPKTIFLVTEIPNLAWDPKSKNDYQKTDILNKHLPECH